MKVTKKKLKELKELYFIKDITIESKSSIKITFNKTGLKYRGLTYYLGEIMFIIEEYKISLIDSKDYRITIANDLNKYISRIHPHSTANNCCFGDTKYIILDLIRNNNYLSVSLLFWQWLHTFRPNSSYTSHISWKKECFREGIPIWNTRSKQRILNDGDKLLEPYDKSSYDKLVKKYSKLKYEDLIF